MRSSPHGGEGWVPEVVTGVSGSTATTAGLLRRAATACCGISIAKPVSAVRYRNAIRPPASLAFSASASRFVPAFSRTMTFVVVTPG
jgi:hypothetical protein